MMARALSFLSAVAALAGLAAIAVSTLRPEARAQATPSGWALCNQTSYIVQAATGRPSGKAILVQGWMRLRPGECRTAAPAPLTRGVHYLFARTSTAHRGGRRFWGGAKQLCVDPSNSFAIENPRACEAMGLEARQFREVRINKRDSWRTNFTEPDGYSLDSARTAGLQRLLLDAGVESRGVVGEMDPRRMTAAVSRYRQEARVSASASPEQLIDSLESAAQKRAARVGLTLCNRTAGRVWTAVARRRGEGWESRGWWAIGPNGCARTIDDALIQNVYFVHATMTVPQGERYLAAGGETFCISPAKFVVIGREDCAERLYDEALFTPISPQGREGMLVEFTEKDFLPVGQQPQRQSMPKAAEAEAPRAPGDAGRVGRTPPASAGGGGRVARQAPGDT